MMQPQQKKGLGVWAWVAIGCVGLLVLGALGVGGALWWGARKVSTVAQELANDPTAAIDMMAKINPDIEVVERDAAGGKVTIRNKQTGEVVTLDVDDIREGRISFSTAEGETTMQLDQEAGTLQVHSEGDNGGTLSLGGNTELPSWVPTYPGATSEGVYSAETAEQIGGTFSATTADDVDTVFAYFKSQLDGGGYKVSENRFSGPQGTGGMLVGESADGRQTLTYTLQSSGGQTQVSGMYSQKKG